MLERKAARIEDAARRSRQLLDPGAVAVDLLGVQFTDDGRFALATDGTRLDHMGHPVDYVPVGTDLDGDGYPEVVYNAMFDVAGTDPPRYRGEIWLGVNPGPDQLGAPWQTIVIDTRQTTWSNVDVSPDGTRLIFDMLGDLYTVPIGGGEATARRIVNSNTVKPGAESPARIVRVQVTISADECILERVLSVGVCTAASQQEPEQALPVRKDKIGKRRYRSRPGVFDEL